MSSIPAIWAYSMNLSLGLRPVIISYNVNSTCPPSRAGIGKMFMKASTMLKRAVIPQKRSQSQEAENMFPMLRKLPRESLALTSLDVKSSLKFWILIHQVFHPFDIPAGRDSSKLYRFTSYLKKEVSRKAKKPTSALSDVWATIVRVSVLRNTPILISAFL